MTKNSLTLVFKLKDRLFNNNCVRYVKDTVL